MVDIYGKGMPAFVYVNGEKVTLLDDLRLALYPQFPDGTRLFDPSDLPPREVPLSTDPAEHGVTSRKLIPHGHYHAYVSDADDKGALHPLTGPSVCVYVVGLPVNTTAEMLGRYFEAFDMVAEADIFTVPSGLCSGRGWVVLQHPDKLFTIPPVLEFFPGYFIQTFLSDKIPTRPALQSAPHGMQPSRGAAALFTDAEVPYVASGSHMRKSHVSERGRGGSKTPLAVPTGALSSTPHFFCATIQREEITESVEGGIFWPSPTNRRAFYSTLKRGRVNIIFVLQDCATIFGYARLLPSVTDGDSEGCPIEWLKHHVFLQENDLNGIQSIPIVKMSDGTPLKPEIGDSICKLADIFPQRSVIPERLSVFPQSGPSRNFSGGEMTKDFGRKQIIGDRGSQRPYLVSSPPRPLGGRQPPRAGHLVNNKTSVRRRSYNSGSINNDSNLVPPPNRSFVPPRNL